MAGMIMGEVPSFDDIMEVIQRLDQQLNAMA